MQSSTNSEEIRTQANQILKAVDQFIKAGNLDEATANLEKAKTLDPTNGYIYAFQERISFLREELARKNDSEKKRTSMETAARQKLEDERKRIEEERKRREDDFIRGYEEARKRRMTDEQSQQEDLLRKMMGKTAPPLNPADLKPAPQPPLPTAGPRQEPPAPVPHPPFMSAPTTRRDESAAPPHTDSAASRSRAPNEASSMYKRVLLLAWADGALSPEEESQLRDLRTALVISQQDHQRLEQEVKEESYAHAFSLVWTSGMSAKERSSVINELRKKFHISAEVHSRIESKILAEYGNHEKQLKIYVVDDEEDILAGIVHVLEGAGYHVKAFNTSDEAILGLKQDVPDLIVSDINLETSTIGGFSFYEKVRQLPHLLHVPFVFLSGMTDEGMIRYGKALGADDYLTKPFSPDLLLDTLKGKLKRFGQIKKKDAADRALSDKQNFPVAGERDFG